jgi:hypothetical protein
MRSKIRRFYRVGIHIICTTVAVIYLGHRDRGAIHFCLREDVARLVFIPALGRG